VRIPAEEAVLLDTPLKFSARKIVLIDKPPQVFDLRSVVRDTLLLFGGRGRRVFRQVRYRGFRKEEAVPVDDDAADFRHETFWW
jgi:hypothetical protein